MEILRQTETEQPVLRLMNQQTSKHMQTAGWLREHADRCGESTICLHYWDATQLS